MLLLVLIGMAGAGGLWAAQTPTGPPGYAGSESCAVCHEDIARAFRRNPHFIIDNGRSAAARPREFQGKGCESCHGPGQAHAESGDAKQIFTYKGAAAAAVNQNCFSCHAGQNSQHGRLFGAHDRNQIGCTGCHSVHQAAQPQRALLVASSNALCQQCHLDVRAQFTRPYRHKLQEGAIECVDCHNPHGEPQGAEMRSVSADLNSCLKCHGDKRGPFPFEHAPVRLSACASCHEPHGSSNPRMLARHDQSLLCLECHTSTVTRAGGSPPAFHDLRSARFRNCTICHSKIHGSFVSRDLLR